MILGDRIVDFTLLSQHIAKVAAGSSKVRIELGGPCKMSNGIIRSTKRAQGQSDVVVENGNPIVQCNRLADQVYGQVVTAALRATTPRRCKLST